MGQEKNIELWDAIIVGAGPAGSNAAMVLARMRRKVLVIDDGHPRNGASHGMHNFLTRDGMLPTEFLSLAHEELRKYHVSILKGKVINARKYNENYFQVEDGDGIWHSSKKLLLATGVSDHIPDVKGMKEFWGRGVYHCPYCDGYELCDKKLGLYAKKYNGYGMAMALTQLSKELVLFTDGRKYLKQKELKVLERMGIRVETGALKELTCSKDKITCVTLQDGRQVGCDFVFTHHGASSNNALFLQLGGNCTKKGNAVTNRRQQCNISGVYVAGDAALDIQFVVVAAAEGAKAGVNIHNDLLDLDHAQWHIDN